MCISNCTYLTIFVISRYGDVTPKTILGRLFTILWISAGLVILAMYMGVVTTSLTATRLEGTQHFYGITVRGWSEKYIDLLGGIRAIAIFIRFVPVRYLTLSA